MDSRIELSVQQFGVSNYLFDEALNDLSREELLRCPNAETNPMLWNAGHVTTSRCVLSTMIGMQREIPWPQLFARGAKRVSDPAEYPSIDEIRTVWLEVTEELMQRFEILTDKELAKEAPFGFPIADKTIRGGISFLAYHEACHIGQMSYLRKWLGRGQLVG
jgi:hypothetical protein